MNNQNHQVVGLTPIETAKRLSISKTHIYNMIAKGEIKVTKLGGRYIIPSWVVEELLQVS